MPEKYCQGVFVEELRKPNLKFEKELYATLCNEGKVITKYFLDFLIENLIAVELNVRPRVDYIHIDQVVGYLKATNQKLAILIYFTGEGVKYRRILNPIKNPHRGFVY